MSVGTYIFCLSIICLLIQSIVLSETNTLGFYHMVVLRCGARNNLNYTVNTTHILVHPLEAKSIILFILSQNFRKPCH